MKHVFIDTNIYLNLYDYSKDDIKKLQALVDLQRSSKLNRETKIKQTLDNPQFNVSNFTIPQLASQYSQEANQLRQSLIALRKIVKHLEIK